MAPGAGGGAVRDLNESRKQALQALISSLAPKGSTGQTRLGEDHVGALSEKLYQLLGDSDGSTEHRNEDGELLNEEGLPIVEISEPADYTTEPALSSEPLVPEHGLKPLSHLSEQERLRLRARRDRILDMLEEEEERKAEGTLERKQGRREEELAKRKEETKAEMDRKLAAREMQKKLGKALLKNIAEQREREDKERLETVESVTNSVQTRAPNAAKPRKSVSFANLPEVDKEKPKPPAAWGDVSLAALKTGMPKARLKADVLSRQPMKLEVVERIPGECREPQQEPDSDDESDPGYSQNPEIEDDEGYPPGLGNNFDGSDESAGSDEDSEDDDIDFSQAKLQRDVALEYIRLRQKIGTEVQQALTSHSHEGEDAWDQPRVPLEATLSSKPAKPEMSRFKAARQPNLANLNGHSVSLGASIIPQGRSHALHGAVRTGKLSDGRLVGGEESESASDDEDSEIKKRMLDMLKSGIVSEEPATITGSLASPQGDGHEKLGNEHLASSSSASDRAPPADVAPPRRTSKFLKERVAPAPPSAKQAPSEPVLSSPLRSAVTERLPLEKSVPNSLAGAYSSEADRAQERINTPFKKPLTNASVPPVPPAQHHTLLAPKIKADLAVLSTMVIDSPSFPPPSSSKGASPQLSPLVTEVRESIPVQASATVSPVRQLDRKVSRFKAERM
ncbi:hypothetical protein M0805_003042 [Coniferiporia weirii]|nr:hypothetical protein M0805_003042 [Coniferiporia weirii]